MRVDASMSTPAERLRNRTVAETIRMNLYPSLGKVDVYVAIATRETANEPPPAPSAGATAACELLRPDDPSSRLFCDIWKEKPLPYYLYAGGIWETYLLGISLAQSLLQQLYQQQRCLENIRTYERLSGERYDYIVRLRPDTAFYDPVAQVDTLDFGSPEEPRVLISPENRCCCGNQDWFAIGTRDVMNYYLDRVLHLQAMKWDLPPNWNSEWYLGFILQTYANAKLVQDLGITACIIKPTTRVVYGQA